MRRCHPPLKLHLQFASRARSLPSPAAFRRWVGVALERAARPVTEITVRLVNRAEMTRLNTQFRGKKRPTNVLAFPFAPPPGVPLPVLGDIVICAPVVAEEARAQRKTPQAHFAHLTVHGVLHLLGLDHHTRLAAARMEKQEVAILQHLGFPDPYR